MTNKELLQAAIEVATLGGEHTLNYFKKDIQVDSKSDDSPVTVADKETEALMRKAILTHFPEHGIIGEEFGRENEGSNIQWILDPIDGTKSFIHQIPFYTTLIGIMVDGKPEVGVIYAPATDELCAAAIGEGATLNGKSCSVRDTKDLGEASLMLTDLYEFHNQGLQEPFMDLMSKTKLHRTWGDAYGHMMVATGRADIMFDPILNIWDAAALLPIIKEAGGVYTDIHGVESIETGSGISTNKYLHSEVIKIFST